MATWDFDAMLAEQAGIRPTFRIAGQEFTVRAKLPYASWSKIMETLRADGADLEAQKKFFRIALISSDRERFARLLDSEDDDDNRVIGLAQISAITDKLLEHFTGKLQSGSNGSSPGSSETGQSPNVVSLPARTIES